MTITKEIVLGMARFIVNYSPAYQFSGVDPADDGPEVDLLSRLGLARRDIKIDFVALERDAQK